MATTFEGPALRRAEWFVSGCTMRQLHEMIGREHYAGRGANTATYRHGLYRRADGACLGVAWWIPPTRAAAEASWDGDWQQVLSLSRLACRPEAPTNSASYLIAQSIKLIRRDGRFRCLITYADEWRGHTGAIYRATNWEYIGLTMPEATFVDAEGRMSARKAGPRTRTHQEMIDAGCSLVGRYARHKFRIILPEFANPAFHVEQNEQFAFL